MSWDTDAYDVDAYLDALGLDKREPSLDYLGDLHQRHVETFPFTSVNVLIGNHPGVDPATAFDQLVTRRRGGYCLEHAQVFAGVVEKLGFTAERRFGRVHTPDNSRSHMTVLVTLDGRTYLCDPGFGFSIRRPLPLVDGSRINQGGRVFSLARDTRTWTLYRDGTVQHIIDDLPVAPVDVATAHAYLQHGFGPFSSKLMAMRYRPDGHETVTGTSRTVRIDDQPTAHDTLSAEEALVAVENLGVSLDGDRRERLRRALERGA